MEDAGFEPGTAASAVWRIAKEPPHLLVFNYRYSFKII